MIVACPACKTRYEVDAARLRGGRGRLRCARCSAVFPVETGAGAPAAIASPTASPERAPARRIEVALVAMEAGAVRDAMLAALEAGRVRTLTATDGPGALESVRRSRPHLAVLAYHLPGLTGPEIASAIRDEATLAGVRIVLIGGPEHQARHGATATGAHDVEGHLRADADPAAIRHILLGVLGLSGGSIPGPSGDELARLAWLAAEDATLYHPKAVADARGARRATPELAEIIEAARLGCIDRHPELRSAAQGVETFVSELERALGVRN